MFGRPGIKNERCTRYAKVDVEVPTGLPYSSYSQKHPSYSRLTPDLSVKVEYRCEGCAEQYASETHYLQWFHEECEEFEELNWRRVPESNRCTRICNPLHNHSANAPLDKAANTTTLRLTLQEPGGEHKKART